MEPTDASGESILFSYFLIRLRRTAHGPDGGLAGLVERLGTGEKKSFASADELLALVSGSGSAFASIEETSAAGHPAERPVPRVDTPSTRLNPKLPRMQ